MDTNSDVDTTDDEETQHENDDSCCIKLYLLTNKTDKSDTGKKNVKTQTYIGSVGDLKKRVNKHNGVGGKYVRATKKAAPNWELTFAMVAPCGREFKCSDLKDGWKKTKRGKVRRLLAGIEIAKKYGMPWMISKQFLEENQDKLGGLWKKYLERMELEDKVGNLDDMIEKTVSDMRTTHAS